MRTPDQWFNLYGESHQNPTNKLVHWICVPAIMFSIIGLFWAIPQPGFMASIAWLNWGTVFVALAMLFYLRLSPMLALGMVFVAGAMLYGVWAIEQAGLKVWLVSLIIFVAAWVGQFIGHKIEGKKPSFFQDLQFLLIGPIWLLGFIYRRIGLQY